MGTELTYTRKEMAIVQEERTIAEQKVEDMELLLACTEQRCVQQERKSKRHLFTATRKLERRCNEPFMPAKQILPIIEDLEQVQRQLAKAEMDWRPWECLRAAQETVSRTQDQV